MNTSPAGDAFIGIDGNKRMLLGEGILPFGPDRELVYVHIIGIGIGAQSTIQNILTAAGEAAGCLFHGLGLIDSSFHFLEIMFPFRQRHMGLMDPGTFGNVFKIRLIHLGQLLPLADIERLFYWLHFPAGQVLVDGTRGRPSIGDGLYDCLGASKKVPANKQIGDGGLQGLGIGIRGPPFGKNQFLQVRIILQKGQIRKLANGDNGQIRFIDLLGTGYGNRSGPSPGIRLFQLIADEFHGLEPAVFSNNPGRGNQ